MKKELTKAIQIELLATLQKRFEKNPERHNGIHWIDVEKKLSKSPGKLWSLNEMERTGGERLAEYGCGR